MSDLYTDEFAQYTNISDLYTDEFVKYTDEFAQYIDEPRLINVKYVNPYNPYSEITDKDTNTIVLPKLDDLTLSNINVLDDSTFSECLDLLLFNFNILSQAGEKVCTMFFNKIEEFFIHLNLITFQIDISNDIMIQIQRCIDKNPTGIIILPVRLDFLNIKKDYDLDISNDDINKDVNTAHSNLIIIDNTWKTIEFYEPHGITLGHAYSEFIQIPQILEKFIKTSFTNINNYSFVNVSSNCPIGAQTLQGFHNISAGHCLAWSLYFIMVRILNYNFLPIGKNISQTINEIITKGTPQEIDSTIRRFLTYIETLGVLPSRVMTHINKYNLQYFIENQTQIETRLRNLIRLYFMNAIFYKRNFKLIFEEIISYKTLPNYHEIFIDELNKAHNNVNLNDYINLDYLNEFNS
jgi:hypothetical protein